MRKKLHALLFTPQDWFGFILLAALINGLIYTFIIPPWWHYDEPGHFEYAWMVINKNLIPSADDVDESFRRELALSLQKYRYYEFITPKLNLDSSEPVFIGVPQYVNLPLYYWYASLPLRLIPNADYAIQNYAIRLMTLGLFLAVLWLIWKTIRKITPEHHPLRWMVPLFLAFLPGFVELMTSISDDAGAVFTFSLFLYFAICLIIDPFNWRNLFGLFFSSGLCLLTKNTVWISLPFVSLVLVFVIFKDRLKWVGWTIIAVVLLSGIILTTRWGDAASWAPTYGANLPTRIQSANAVDGQYELVFSPQNEKIAQFLPASTIKTVRAKPVTLGAWIWTDLPTEARLPYLVVSTPDGAVVLENVSAVSLDIQPRFFSTTYYVPSDAGRGWVFLQPFPASNNSDLLHVYYDGVVLVSGEFDNSQPLLDGDRVSWNEKKLSNLLRNPSAEKAWFGSSLEKYVGPIPIPIFNWSATLATIQDIKATSLFLTRIRDQLLITFWAQPAKNYITLLGGRKTALIFYLVTSLALIGCVEAIWRVRKNIPWEAAFILGFTALVLWFQTFIRGSSELFNTSEFIIPFARYAAPAILGTALILCAGWQSVFFWLQKILHVTPASGANIFLAFMAGLNLFTLFSILDFFYLPNGEVQTRLFLSLITALFFGFQLLRIRISRNNLAQN